MAGYFPGVVQTPMTAFVIILEMTGDYRAVIPIMAASMIGYVSRVFSRETLYHGVSRVFIAAAVRARRAAGKTLGEVKLHRGNCSARLEAELGTESRHY